MSAAEAKKRVNEQHARNQSGYGGPDRKFLTAEVIETLGRVQPVKKLGYQEWLGRCPVHQAGDRDIHPELRLMLHKDESLMARCNAGCAITSVNAVLGTDMRLIPAIPAQAVDKEFRGKTTCMADVERKPVQWLWSRRLALGCLSTLAGRPGDGKTWLTMAISARVSRGGFFPDGAHAPLKNVLILSGEDDPAYTLKPRLEACGADCSRVHILESKMAQLPGGKVEERVITLQDIEIIEEEVKRLKPGVLIVDPIGTFMGGEVDTNRDNAVRAVLAPLKLIAERNDLAVLIVAHTRKAKADFADDLIMGSRAFSGIVRASWHLFRDQEDKDRRLLLPGKNNLARQQTGLAFRIDGFEEDQQGLIWDADPIDMHADDYLKEEAKALADGQKPGPKTAKTAEAGDWLMDQLRHGPKLVTDILRTATDAGFSERTVQRAAGFHAIETERTTFGGKAAWKLPAAPVCENNSATWRDSENQAEIAFSDTGEYGENGAPPNVGENAADPLSVIVTHAPEEKQKAAKSKPKKARTPAPKGGKK